MASEVGADKDPENSAVVPADAVVLGSSYLVEDIEGDRLGLAHRLEVRTDCLQQITQLRFAHETGRCSRYLNKFPSLHTGVCVRLCA